MTKLAARIDCADPTHSEVESAPSQTSLGRIPHCIELEVQRRLLAQPGLKIDSLVVRRVDQGICIQGTVESYEQTRDICSLVKSVEGVNHVLNRLLVANKP